jgi:hypothetical protein
MSDTTPKTFRRGSKAEFIRLQPLSRTASEVIAAAKANGIRLTDKSVYSVRSMMRQAAASAAKRKPGRQAGALNKPKTSQLSLVSVASTVAANGRAGSSSNAEQSFKRILIRLGVDRAQEMLDTYLREAEQQQ